MVAYPAVSGGNSLSCFNPSVKDRLGLQYLRASGLAQARLQLAVLSGNRRRALEQIDRLVAIDRQLQHVAEGTIAIASPPETLEAELADQRLAIASEKLALTSGIELPRLEPALVAGMVATLSPDEPVEIVEIVEDEVLRKWLGRLLLIGLVLLILCVGISAAAVVQF